MLLGLGSGAVYGAIALGIVLVHRASGVVNFAHGAMAMYATYVFVELRGNGDLVLPLVGIPSRVHLAEQLPTVVCLGVALEVAAGLGLAAYLLVFRHLRAAPPLARVIAGIGIMVTLQALAALQFGADNRAVPAVLPTSRLSLLGLTVPLDRLVLGAIVAAAAAGLSVVYRFTRFGLASRAAATDETAVSLLGYSPDALAAVTWAVAGVVAGLGGVLVGPLTALNPVSFTLLVVPALAAALVGRLSSFGITVVAALGLGMAQALVTKLQAGFEWVPRVGLRDGLPLLLVVAAMARGDRFPRRAEPRVRALPMPGRPRHPVRTAALGGVAGVVAVVCSHGGARLALVTSMTGAIVCLSLVVLTGYLGQISLAQMAFAGIAGFSLARLGDGLGVPFPLAPLFAATLAGAAGALVGVPALRVRGLGLAVLTLSAAVAVEELVFKSAVVTGGLAGTRVGAPHLLGLDLGIAGGAPADHPRTGFALLVLAVLVAVALLVAAVRAGRSGRRLLAVRADERAAEAAGVDTSSTKLGAFALSAFIAGTAGALIGYAQGQLSFESFSVFASLSFLAVACLGGIASISGAMIGGALVAGGVVFTFLDAAFGLGRYRLLVTGLSLVAATVAFPGGLATAVSGAAARVARRPARRAGG